MQSSGPSGPPQALFEDGLRFMATALALHEDHRHDAAIVTAACDAIQCFLAVFEAAARKHLPDPDQETTRLRGQLEALLTPRQSSQDAAHNALEAARLARDQAALLLPRLLD
ncbi:MAG TPA: hypothetical protein VJ486_00035 [Geothrix sp.]|nr:hypothetical protein [Geothrix sp.]